VFTSLVQEMAGMAEAFAGNGLTVVADTRTARDLPALAGLVELADHVVLRGDPEDCPLDPALVAWVTADELPESREQVFAVYSSRCALIAMLDHDPANHGQFVGGWSWRREYVLAAMRRLAGTHRGVLPARARRGAALLAADADHATRLTGALVTQLVQRAQDAAMDKDDLFAVLEILQAMSSKRRHHELLFCFVEQIARTVEVQRCSVLHVHRSDGTGKVEASHDDPELEGLELDLRDHPELVRALESGTKVVIDEASRDPLTASVATQLRSAGVDAIIVIPIVVADPTVGTLLLRATRSHRPFTTREVSFCEIVAEAAANAFERAYLIESIQAANQKLERLAVTDGLTGLNNHRAFRQRLEEEFERALRYAMPLSVVIVDLDDFKRINDTLGHLQGDEVLREVGRRCEKATRRTDFAARYGGEEFAILMPQTNLAGAMVQAERLRADIAEPGYAGLPPEYSVTASIGAAGMRPGVTLDPSALVGDADDALYRAKRLGKNRVEAATQEDAET
jgi:diguanylate cyclase (GGDEF)-like protein